MLESMSPRAGAACAPSLQAVSRRAAASCVLAVTLAVVFAAPPASGASAEQERTASALQAGDPLPPLSLEDQDGKAVAVDDSTRLLLFTRDMDAGALVKEALAEDGASLLSAAGAVYVSDVSGMPGLVRSLFAMPALRRRPYPVALDESGEATAGLPHEEGKVTVLALESGRITAVSHPSSIEQVRAALGK